MLRSRAIAWKSGDDDSAFAANFEQARLSARSAMQARSRRVSSSPTRSAVASSPTQSARAASPRRSPEAEAVEQKSSTESAAQAIASGQSRADAVVSAIEHQAREVERQASALAEGNRSATEAAERSVSEYRSSVERQQSASLRRAETLRASQEARAGLELAEQEAQARVLEAQRASDLADAAQRVSIQRLAEAKEAQALMAYGKTVQDKVASDKLAAEAAWAAANAQALQAKTQAMCAQVLEAVSAPVSLDGVVELQRLRALGDYGPDHVVAHGTDSALMYVIRRQEIHLLREIHTWGIGRVHMLADNKAPLKELLRTGNEVLLREMSNWDMTPDDVLSCASDAVDGALRVGGSHQLRDLRDTWGMEAKHVSMLQVSVAIRLLNFEVLRALIEVRAPATISEWYSLAHMLVERVRGIPLSLVLDALDALRWMRTMIVQLRIGTTREALSAAIAPSLHTLSSTEISMRSAGLHALLVAEMRLWVLQLRISS